MPNPAFRYIVIRSGVFCCLAALLLLCGCAVQLEESSISPTAEDLPAEEFYNLYFSAPDDPASSSLRGGLDVHLVKAIESARLSVDMAALELDLWSLRDALIAAHRRGVVVRLVTDSEYLKNPEIQDLQAAGIVVHDDRREGLMHHKFVLIDRQEVWTGSMNFTVNGFYRNDNNLIQIRSTLLAENYLREFEEMFIQNRFGDNSEPDTPHPELTLGGMQLKNYFSPDDGVAEHLEKLISNAQESVAVLAYSFTLDELSNALINRAKAGVLVRGVFDSNQALSNTGGDYQRLVDAGVDIRLDGNPNSMHHKVLIIDQQIVVMGSYNFSSSAERRNDENVLVLENPEIADQFLVEFERVYDLAEP
jgi:phosphatidylserine/phosphatidylglycerophosphate/cardiolipin synthase-like enzyme